MGSRVAIDRLGPNFIAATRCRCCSARNPIRKNLPVSKPGVRVGNIIYLSGQVAGDSTDIAAPEPQAYWKESAVDR